MLMTPDKNYTVALFAGYVASVDDPAWEVVFSDASAFEAWLIQAQERSTFDSSVNQQVMTGFLHSPPAAMNLIMTICGVGGSAGTINFIHFTGIASRDRLAILLVLIF